MTVADLIDWLREQPRDHSVMLKLSKTTSVGYAVDKDFLYTAHVSTDANRAAVIRCSGASLPMLDFPQREE